MRLATLVLPALLLTGACSVKKSMDEMHDKTIQMADTTQELQTSATETKDVLVCVSAIQKQGGGYELRSKAFERMQEADTLNLKLKESKAYYYAFDFQIASYNDANCLNMLEIRKELAGLAVSELGKTLPEVMPSGTSWRLDATKSDNKNESLMALSATLHEINVYQGPQAEPFGLRPISMYELIAEGLLKKNSVNNGRLSLDNLTPADKEVLREEQIFTHLLKRRMRTLPVIALGRVSNIQDGLIEKFSMLFFTWKPRFEELNAEQINYAAAIIEKALETRTLLTRLDVESKIDSKVERILKKMKTTEVREKLDDALGRNGAAPAYRLTMSLAENRYPRGVRVDNVANRYELVLVVDYTLTAVGGGPVKTGHIQSSVTYDSADQPYASIAAEQDGQERAAGEAARQIQLDLAAWLAQRGAVAPKVPA